MRRYIELAKELGMAGVVLLGPDQAFLGPHAALKCRWDCQDHARRSLKCSSQDTSFAERRKMLKSYRNILLVHGHNAHQMSKAVLEIERRAFPGQMRPCDQAFRIDVHHTARQAGLPCQLLQDNYDTRNRYDFALLD